MCQGVLANDNPAGLECESCHRVWIQNGEGWETVPRQVSVDSSKLKEGESYTDAVKVINKSINMQEDNAGISQSDAQAPVPSITNFRQRLDMFINSTIYLRPGREVSLAHTHLQRAFMWLGKAQGAAGGESPYKNSFDHKTATIEPTADHSPTSLMNALWDLPEYGTHTARVKSLREQISIHLNEFRQYYKDINDPAATVDYLTYLSMSRFAAEEASMWLGWELARIKKEQDNPPSVGMHPASNLPL